MLLQNLESKILDQKTSFIFKTIYAPPKKGVKKWLNEQPNKGEETIP